MYSGKGFGVKFRAPCCCIGGWSGDTGNVDEVCSWPIGRRTPTAALRAKMKIPSTAVEKPGQELEHVAQNVWAIQ